MINRLLSIAKRLVFGFFKLLLYILRCGRRKRAPVDDTLPTDIVIGDAVNIQGNSQPFTQTSAMSNGYEMPSQPHMGQKATQPDQNWSDEARHADGDNADESQPWGEWDYGPANAEDQESSKQGTAQDLSINNSPKEEDVDFFADMEPTVKVKKIFVKKKQHSVSSEPTTNRFSINQDLDFKAKTDLEDWEDNDDSETGWEEDDIVDEIDPSMVAKEARQMRKQERIMRLEEQTKSKQSRDPRTKKGKLGTKVS